jgi:AcrR family transcriptional regulator
MAEQQNKAWTQDDVDAGIGRSLQPYDWILAGIALLTRGGPEAVRITQLADELKVTRGSFYWHFKDRQELLDALISFWRGKYTASMVVAVENAQDLATGLLDLIGVWVALEQFDPRLESAIREWARTSDQARTAIEAADEERVGAVAALFERNGYEPTEALVRARVIYFTQIGYYALELDETLVERIGFLEAYYQVFTGRALDPAVAAQFRKAHLGSVSGGVSKGSTA